MEDMQTWWPLTAHPSLGVGAVLPVPPRTMGSTPPACLDTGSFGSSVPASYPDTKFHLLSGSCQNISEMKDVIFSFSFFHWRRVETQRRGSHHLNCTLHYLMRSPSSASGHPPFQTHDTLCTWSIGWAVLSSGCFFLARGPAHQAICFSSFQSPLP